MKKSPLISAICCPAISCALFLAPAIFGAPLDQHDRERALSELHASRKQLLDSIAGLSPAQWTYKAGPDRWSIQEVAEHITVAEGLMRGRVTTQLMSSPADPDKAAKPRATNAVSDEKILAQLRDRSHKVSAPSEIVPKGIYKTPGDAADAFKSEREKTLEYVRTTSDALRDHFSSPQPGVEMDGVQELLLIAGHNERHVEQIEEVKRSPGYPKR
jgi:hypothetical protein